MKLLECKDQLTINELLRIAFEYGNDNADMPTSSEGVEDGFSEWIETTEPLFKKLILPHVVLPLKCDCKHSGSCRYEEVVIDTKEVCRHKE
jgi:hypothetical protein